MTAARFRRFCLTSACLIASASACERHPAGKLSSVSAAGAPSVAASPPPGVQAAPGSAALPAAPTPATDPPVCAPLLAQQRALAVKWPEPPYVPPVLGHCYATHGGAWLVSFDAVRVASEGPALSARFSVLHLAPGPHVGDVTPVAAPFEPSPFTGVLNAPSLPADANYVLSIGSYYTDVFAPTLFDYDGDGEAELLFTMQAYVSEGAASGSVGRLFTFKQGAVQRYAPDPGLHWTNVDDVDRDGRPDLVGLYGPVAVTAHSLQDGSFSKVDAVAQAFARRACPAARKAVFLSVDNESGLPEGYAASGWNGACARLWGASADSVIREIDRHCSTTNCTSKSVVSDAIVESAATYRAEARRTPPLLLHEQATDTK